MGCLSGDRVAGVRSGVSIAPRAPARALAHHPARAQMSASFSPQDRAVHDAKQRLEQARRERDAEQVAAAKKLEECACAYQNGGCAPLLTPTRVLLLQRRLQQQLEHARAEAHTHSAAARRAEELEKEVQAQQAARGEAEARSREEMDRLRAHLEQQLRESDMRAQSAAEEVERLRREVEQARTAQERGAARKAADAEKRERMEERLSCPVCMDILVREQFAAAAQPSLPSSFARRASAADGQVHTLLLPCSHVLCEPCWRSWSRENRTCPTCRQPLRKHQQPPRCRQVDDMVEAWVRDFGTADQREQWIERAFALRGV